MLESCARSQCCTAGRESLCIRYPNMVLQVSYLRPSACIALTAGPCTSRTLPAVGTLALPHSCNNTLTPNRNTSPPLCQHRSFPAEQLREVNEHIRHLASLAEAPIEKDKETLDALDDIKVLLEQRRNELEEQIHRSRKAPHESDEKIDDQDTMEQRRAKDLKAQLAQKAE
jgi:hypothetical protein